LMVAEQSASVQRVAQILSDVQGVGFTMVSIATQKPEGDVP